VCIPMHRIGIDSESGEGLIANLETDTAERVDVGKSIPCNGVLGLEQFWGRPRDRSYTEAHGGGFFASQERQAEIGKLSMAFRVNQNIALEKRSGYLCLSLIP
jgi:hypothetical protein